MFSQIFDDLRKGSGQPIAAASDTQSHYTIILHEIQRFLRGFDGWFRQT